MPGRIPDDLGAMDSEKKRKGLMSKENLKICV
jgi:hypothetical protein